MREKRFISWQGDCSIIILLCSKLTSFAVSGNLAAAAVLQKKPVPAAKANSHWTNARQETPSTPQDLCIQIFRLYSTTYSIPH